MFRDMLAPGEWYHCYNRGVDHRKTFMHARDYERMQDLLYLTNATKSIHRSDKHFSNRAELFQLHRGGQLVDIAAYCLMPNHFHLLVRTQSDGGVSQFMRKLMTAYTMYFNIKNERVGNLFYKPFRSSHVSDDRYGQRVYNYILSNPWELVHSESRTTQIKFIESYPYSSLYDHICERPETTILSNLNSLPFIKKPTPTILADAIDFSDSKHVKVSP